MSEIDTFNALKRTPFMKMVDQIRLKLFGNVNEPHGCDLVVKYFSNGTSTYLSEAWKKFYMDNNWTFEEFVDECKREYDRR